MLISTGNLTRDSLAHQVVVLTGAGGGIGFEAARSLIWLGARVVIAEVDKRKGAEAAQRLTDEFGLEAVLFVQTDVGDEGSVQRLAQEAQRCFGQVDVVLNNATLAPYGKKVHDTSIMDDREAAQASVEKLKSLNIKTIYPGHGAPFLMDQFQVSAVTASSTPV